MKVCCTLCGRLGVLSHDGNLLGFQLPGWSGRFALLSQTLLLESSLDMGLCIPGVAFL